MNQRYAVFEGSFYPAGQDLSKAVDNFFIKARVRGISFDVKAIIVPHAGYIYSGVVAAACYGYLKGKNFKKIILIGPSHQAYIESAYADDNDVWINSLGEVKVDNETIKKLGIEKSRSCQSNEHSLEVQIPFLQRILKDFEIIPIVINEYDSKLADKIEDVLDDETLIVISSDFSHYLTYPEAEKVDKETVNRILKLDLKGFLENNENTACGNAGISVVMKIAKDLGWKPMLAEYKNSGDTAGDKRKVVGYAGILFTA